MKGYLTYYVPIEINGNSGYAKAFVRILDLKDFDNISISQPINVPGTVIGSSISGDYIYTIDYQYASRDSYRTIAYLNTLLVSDNKAYLQDRIQILPAPEENSYSYISGYVVKDEKLYYTIYQYSWDKDYKNYNYKSTLNAVSLIDPENITLKSTTVLKGFSTGSMKLIDNRLFITSYDYVGGLLVYKLIDPFNPVFEGFYRTDGWTSADNVVASGNKAFVISGPYGVQTIILR
jgi:hypothetical protein